jgi:23S rRNA (guanine2445-N2)-methyltransferase / 23S rRNA (guanine2069-N7)-methyltransferase
LVGFDRGSAQPARSRSLKLPPIHGYDRDALAIRAARDNIKRAGLGNLMIAQQRELAACAPEQSPTGLVVINPPYGERLGPSSEQPALYAELGTQLKTCFPGWRAAVFTGNPELGKSMGLRATKMHTLYNGAIECKLLHFEITPENVVVERAPKPFEIRPGSSAEMFANRLRKDLQHFGRWARRQEISCYRLYDADCMNTTWRLMFTNRINVVHVQEYEAPDTISPDKARQRLQRALGVIPLVLEIPREQMFFKVRRRQKAAGNRKTDETGAFHGTRRSVPLPRNFTDYLDTGLFSTTAPHARCWANWPGKRFLNLLVTPAPPRCMRGSAVRRPPRPWTCHTPISIGRSEISN